MGGKGRQREVNKREEIFRKTLGRMEHGIQIVKEKRRGELEKRKEEMTGDGGGRVDTDFG